MNYVLKIDGQWYTCSSEGFNRWVKLTYKTIGHNFEIRLEQLRRYTGRNVTDWEMVDGD
jgi:hypothetical protein